MLPQVLLCLLVVSVYAQHPECRWQCDEIVAPAVCTPKCSAPACELVCEPGGSCLPGAAPTCWITCPTDQAESDSCPNCVIQCAETPAYFCSGNCTTLCEAPQCSWSCRLPDMPYPICQRVCEHPACEYSSGSSMHASALLLIILCTLLAI
jgi:hypothetical protein